MSGRNCCRSLRLPGTTYEYNITSVATSIGQTIFVDQTTGNDSTGTPYRLDKMYATITAAQAVAVSGDTIIIYPGTYTDYNLGKNGVTFHFEKGAEIILTTGNRDIFLANTATDITVTGYGVFQSTGCLILLYPGTGYIVNITGYSATCDNGGTNGSATIESVASGAIVNINMAENISNAQDNIIRMPNLGHVLNITCNNIIAASSAALVYGGGAGSISELNINAKYIVSTDIGVNVGATRTLLTNTGANVYIHANMAKTNVGLFLGLDLTGGKTYIYGNIDIACDSSINIIGATECYLYGKLTGGQIICSGATKLQLNDEVIASVDGPVINLAGGILEIKDRVKNLSNTFTSTVIQKSGGTLILDGAILVVTDPLAFSIDCFTNQDIKIYSAVANSNTGGAGIITNLIIGTNLIVDTDVV